MRPARILAPIEGRPGCFEVIVHTRFREQPAWNIAVAQGWPISDLARSVGVPHGHLYRVLTGRAAPSPTVRRRLPEVLGLPLADLFTEEALAAVSRHRTEPRS